MTSNKARKVLVIGLPKTGLSSLWAALHHLGYHRHGTSKPLLKAYFRNDFASINAYLDEFEAVSDWPVPLVYKSAFHRYGPDACYILSLRRDPDVWVESLKRHAMGTHPLKTWFPRLFGYRWPHGFERQFRAFYESYNADALRFFEANGASSQLMTFCCETGDSWQKLCAFIGCDPPVGMPFPRENVSAERKTKHFRLAYNTVGSRLYSVIAPRLKSGKAICLP